MNTTPSSPDPPPPPQLQSMFPASNDEYPKGVPEPGSEDWLWYHPGTIRGHLSFAYHYLCLGCDVAGDIRGQKPPRCWNCGRFAKHYWECRS